MLISSMENEFPLLLFIKSSKGLFWSPCQTKLVFYWFFKSAYERLDLDWNLSLDPDYIPSGLKVENLCMQGLILYWLRKVQPEELQWIQWNSSKLAFTTGSTNFAHIFVGKTTVNKKCQFNKFSVILTHKTQKPYTLQLT